MRRGIIKAPEKLSNVFPYFWICSPPGMDERSAMDKSSSQRCQGHIDDDGNPHGPDSQSQWNKYQIQSVVYSFSLCILTKNCHHNATIRKYLVQHVRNQQVTQFTCSCTISTISDIFSDLTAPKQTYIILEIRRQIFHIYTCIMCHLFYNCSDKMTYGAKYTWHNSIYQWKFMHRYIYIYV